MKRLADTAVQKWEQHAAAMTCAEGEEDAQARQAWGWSSLLLTDSLHAAYVYLDAHNIEAMAHL